MTHLLVIMTTAALILLAPEPKTAEPATAAARVPYAAGMQALLSPMCEQACARGPETCLERCMEPHFETAEAGSGTDEAACNARGGILSAQMPPCGDALLGMLVLHADSDLGAAWDVVQTIYRDCSVDALCGEP